MANPRATVDFTDLRVEVVTMLRLVTGPGLIDFLQTGSNPYATGRSSQIGQSVSIAAAKTARVGAAGDTLFGVLTDSYSDNTCAVQDWGYLKLPYTAGATAPVLGRGVVCDGVGGVAIAAAGSEWKERGVVVDLDTTNHIATIKL